MHINNSDYLVTILLVTYNHINTFEKAINSVFNQKTNFSYQVIVLDDASNDGTKSLFSKYSSYKNVKFITREKNLGGILNTYEGLKLINTKYFAVLETDDYWSDENKLQIQVDILENNPDCSFCAHNTLIKFTETNRTREYIKSQTGKFGFPIKKICRKYYIEPHISSRLYRSECLNLNEIKDETVATYDIAINFLYFTKGNLYYIDKIMSVYNYTSKGIYSGATPQMQRFKSANIIYKLNKEFDFKYNYLLADFFAKRLNLNFITQLHLKHTNNKEKLNKLYQLALDEYKKDYLSNRDIKPILKISLPIGKRKDLVFELKREKDRA